VRVVLSAVAAAAVFAGTGQSAAVAIEFRTPSGNIGCAGDSTFVRCDIAATRTKPPPKPRSCRYDWGYAFKLGQRVRARRICVSDSTLDAARVLSYGRTQRFGRRISCTSRRTGLTCRNRDGHGFFMSRQRVRLF